jgi:hypothetical protein
MTSSGKTAGRIGAPLDVRTRAVEYWLLLARFSRRYGPAVLTLFLSVIIGWLAASSVSDYTKGGWEIHFIERGIGLNLHFHHWYYGLPLGLLAFAVIELSPNVSIFLFGLGQTLAAHSFINEGGIPSIVEGGATWRIAPEVYFPFVTAFALLYAFFIIRREDWLVRAREREEISESYLCPKARTDDVIQRLDDWAEKYLTHKKQHTDADTNIQYGHWHTLDAMTNSEWQLDYVISPFDDQLNLLVVRLVHIPLKGRASDLADRIRELDAVLKPLAQPVIGGPQAAGTPSAALGQ